MFCHGKPQTLQKNVQIHPGESLAQESPTFCNIDNYNAIRIEKQEQDFGLATNLKTHLVEKPGFPLYCGLMIFYVIRVEKREMKCPPH
jgi:hypothetical protein